MAPHTYPESRSRSPRLLILLREPDLCELDLRARSRDLDRSSSLLLLLLLLLLDTDDLLLERLRRRRRRGDTDLARVS